MSPADAGELIGRGEDVRELTQALRAPGVVCVVGVPGIGKTAVARELARVLRTEGRTVLWCDASAATDAVALVVDAARAAGVSLRAGLPLEAALRGAARALDG